MNVMNAIGNLFSQSGPGKVTDHPKDLQLWKEQTRLRTRDDMIALSKEARSRLSHSLKQCKDTDPGETKPDPKLILIKTIIASFIRKAVKDIRSREFSSINKDALAVTFPQQNGDNNAVQFRPNMPLDAHYLYAETQSISFSLNGVLKTADGQEITFELDLNLEKTFLIEKEIAIEAGDGVSRDQAVVSFEGTAAQLTNFSFDFDVEVSDSKEFPSYKCPGWGNVRFGGPAKQQLQMNMDITSLKSSIFSYLYKDGNAGSTQQINLAL